MGGGRVPVPLSTDLEAGEDLAALVDGGDDGGEARGGEDDVRGCLGGVRGARHRDPDVGPLERGGVVDPVPGHADQVPSVLQALDDPVLVLGEDGGEAIDLLHDLAEGALGAEEGVALAGPDLGADDVRPHVEPRARLDRDRPRVPCDHLHLHALLLGPEDRRRCVVPRRVQQRDEAQQLPHLPGGGSGVAGDVHEPGDPEAAEAALGVRQDAVLRRRVDLWGVGGQRHHHIGRPL